MGESVYAARVQTALLLLFLLLRSFPSHLQVGREKGNEERNFQRDKKGGRREEGDVVVVSVSSKEN